MSAQYGEPGTGQPRGRGFGPLFRGPYSDQHLRVSDAERQAVTDRLAEHFSAGRLDQSEFDERVERAMSAKTRADLNGLFDDLPETGAPARSAGPGAPRFPGRRRRHPALALVFVVVIALVAGHVVVEATVPWLFVGFLVVAMLFATGAIGRSRPRQGR
ncbi:MAG: DUF1707 domain-containing protein [Streptosporangiaceae bacterium]|nr:DUF1707 domain-containing protein [Streptosporangiaceae bacterium]MBV9854947.1 DUF1707 domain-containing protein [Streptosporangiaceae bacterium]